jgi:hypothetical protein
MSIQQEHAIQLRARVDRQSFLLATSRKKDNLGKKTWGVSKITVITVPIEIIVGRI